MTDLRPEDIQSLAQLMGPLYRDSKIIDSMMTERCGQMTFSSDTIKQELERLAQSSAPTPVIHQQYIPPQPTYAEPAQVVYHPPQQPTFTPISNFIPLDDQMELNFNISEQEKTNTLLETIVKKLSILISLLEKPELPPITKLNVSNKPTINLKKE